MTGIYLVELADKCRAAGLSVVEFKGWQTRARSSGGFPVMPTAVQWHHTAGSGANPQADCEYMWLNADDRPIGNVYLAPDGTVWVGAAGASNTAGKGGPLRVSRETIPADQANTRTFAIEAANNGVGQAWPQVQVDAFFALSNMLNEWFGNVPTDIFTHSLGAGDGWTNRKIDPATASAVQGPWRPRSVNSSGTWSLEDIRNECVRRASSTPPDPQPPKPPPIGDDDVTTVLILEDARNGAMYKCGADTKSWIRDGNMSAQCLARLDETNANGVAVDGMKYVYMKNGNVDLIRSYGPIVGPLPAGVDEYGG